MYVAEVDGRIVGFGHASSDEIVALFVDPDSVRRGVGRKLIEEGVRRMDAEVVRLEATLNGVPFYEKCGFRCVGSKSIVRRGVKIEIALMTFSRLTQAGH